MGDVLSPFTVSPPPPSSSSPKSSMAMLYYGLAVVGTTAIVLTMYNLIIMGRCSRRHEQSHPQGRNDGVVEVMTASSRRSFESSNRNLLSSFKFKKEAEEREDEGGGEDYECPVCLSAFEEGEEVRKLPQCNHSFHTVCIDMWLYSHLDCPICRTPVAVGHSSESLPAESGISV